MDLRVREATDADATFLVGLARAAYRDVVTRQFGARDDSDRLHTLRMNRAIHFYERHGFVVTAQTHDFLDMERAG
jgi:hypothetical protein